MNKENARQAKLARKARKAAKKQQHQGAREHQTAYSYSYVGELEASDELIRSGDEAEAAELLEGLRQRYPRRLEVLHRLLDVYQRQQEFWSYEGTCARIVELDPGNEDVWLALAGSAMANGQMATAFQAFEHFLTRWPATRASHATKSKFS